MLVPVMTVAENIVLGQEPKRAGGMLDFAVARARVRELSDRYGLAVDPDATIEDVTVGAQQRVEILRALYRGARILVLDEPTAVLTAQEVTELMGVHPAPQGGRHRDRLHQPQAQRGARGGRPDHRAAPRPPDGHRAARGRHRAEPGPARRRPRRAAGRRQGGVEVGRAAAATSTTSTSATTGSCRRSTGCRCRCAPVRSSPSPASTATASRSWSRRSPGCGCRSRAASSSTGGTSPAWACGPPPRRGSPTSPRTAIAAASSSRSRSTENMALREYRRPLFSARGWLRLRRMRDRAGRLLREFDVRGGGPEAFAVVAVGRQPAEGVRGPRDRLRSEGAHRPPADARAWTWARSSSCTGG